MASSTSSSSEPLLTFAESFNFREFARKNFSDMSESARLIGQERDGSILFAWDHTNKGGEENTNIGLYQNNLPSFVILYQHETISNIMSATVNADKTLLAFTIESIQEGETFYDSFVAEIKPQNRVFTLNMPGKDYRKLQFISPNQHSKAGRSHQVSHLLIVIPSVFVLLYKFKLQGAHDGVVVATQPDKQTILRNFLWYQWDPHTQYLYHARFEATTAHREQSIGGSKYTLMLSCTRFVNDAEQQLVFIVPLPLPYKVSLYTDSTTHHKSPFALTLPIREINLQILHRADGYWCVCLQHYTGWSNDQKSAGTEGSAASKVDYSVFLLHNGHVMYGQVPLSRPTSQGLYINFMLIGAFVVAYVPGFMLHLLNVGPRVDPCHHLTFGADHAHFLPQQQQDKNYVSSADSAKACLSLTSAINFAPTSDHTLSLLETNSDILYQCSLHSAGFLTLFKECNDPELMEDLLHLVIVGFSNPGMALSMIEHVCRTPMSFSDHKLFAEFIIASSYANIYQDSKQFIARQLPLTMSPTFQGKVYKNQKGVKLAYLKILAMKAFVKQLLVQSDQKLVAADFNTLINHVPNPEQPFDTLCFNAVINQNNFSRVDMGTLTITQHRSTQLQHDSSICDRERHPKKKASPKVLSGATGFLGKLSTLTKRQTPTQPVHTPSSKNPQEMLWFLDSDEDLFDEVCAEGSHIRERMLVVMGRGLALKPRNIVYNTVLRYYTELQKQSANLLLTIWSSLGFNVDNHPLRTICRSPQPKEQILQELLEAYLLAHLELGLQPPSGFHTLYNSMAFICLDQSLFLQQLHSGVLTPTRRFVDMLLEDCPEEDADIVFHVLSSLDFRLAEYALDRWQDPSFNILKSQRASLERQKR